MHMSDKSSQEFQQPGTPASEQTENSVLFHYLNTKIYLKNAMNGDVTVRIKTFPNVEL